ncbi:reverse transcriptase domain-containing protein [Tanacetum coccineum]
MRHLWAYGLQSSLHVLHVMVFGWVCALLSITLEDDPPPLLFKEVSKGDGHEESTAGSGQPSATVAAAGRHLSVEFSGRAPKLSPPPDLSDPLSHSPPRASTVATTTIFVTATNLTLSPPSLPPLTAAPTPPSTSSSQSPLPPRHFITASPPSPSPQPRHHRFCQSFYNINIIPPYWTPEKRRFFSQVKYYFWDELYAFKLCSDNVMRRCVVGNEIFEILAHCHSRPTGGHHSASITGRKVYKSRFYWLSIFKDAKDYVMKCDAPREGNIDEYWWRIYESGNLEVLES